MNVISDIQVEKRSTLRKEIAFCVGVILVVALGGFSMFVQLKYPELKSVHEARVVVTADNMVDSGEWVVPQFNDSIRLEKPPLPYWVAGIFEKVFGTMDEWVFRLPSAIMGFSGVLLVMISCFLMFGHKAALLSGLFNVFTLKYIIEARTARVDIYLTFWVLVAFCLLIVIFYGKQRRDWVWLFVGTAGGLAVLAKGPAALIFLGPLVLLGYFMHADRRPRAGWIIGAVFAFALPWGSWMALLIDRLSWPAIREVWTADIGRNVVDYSRSTRSPFYYIPHYFSLMFPWVIAAGVAVTLPFWGEMKQRKELRKRIIYLFLMVLIPIIAFSLIRKKKIDYLLPLVPIISILMGLAWSLMADKIRLGRDSAKQDKILAIIQASVFILMGILALVYICFDPFGRADLLILSSASLIVGGLIGIYFIHRHYNLTAAMVAKCVGFGFFTFLLFGSILPQENPKISPAKFARAVVSEIGESPIIYYKGRDETLVYHFDRPIHRADNIEDLRTFLEKNPDAYVLSLKEHLAEARKKAPNIVLHHPRMRDLSIQFPFGDNDEGKYYDIYVLGSKRYAGATNVLETYEPQPPDWYNTTTIWVGFGLIAQAMFFLRFLVQWVASEKVGESVIPVSFWWLSLLGGFMLLGYSIYRRDPVFILGQSTGTLIYLRNIWLIYRRKPAESQPELTQEIAQPQKEIKDSLVTEEK